jgi:hypothetical protein
MILVVVTLLLLVTSAVGIANATILEKEDPPMMLGNGFASAAKTEDDSDRDISISVKQLGTDSFFMNKTQVIDTDGADDIDIDGFPPEDVAVIITSDKVIATKNPVVIEMEDMTPDITDEIIDVAQSYNKTGDLLIRNVISPTPDEISAQDIEEKQDEQNNNNDN